MDGVEEQGRVALAQPAVLVGYPNGRELFEQKRQVALVQLARHAGIRVISVAGPGQQGNVEALGAIPVDHKSDDVSARVGQLAPSGVAAVVDHVGGPGIVASWRMLGRGGSLVAYVTA